MIILTTMMRMKRMIAAERKDTGLRCYMFICLHSLDSCAMFELLIF
jgi:hypothetical protein